MRQSLSTVGECCCRRGPSSSVCRHSPKEYFKAPQRTCPGSIVVIKPKPADKVVYQFVDATLRSVAASEAARACKVVIRRSRPLPALVEGDASMFYHFAMETLPLVLRDAAKHGGLRDLRNHVVSQGTVQCALCFRRLLVCPPLYAYDCNIHARPITGGMGRIFPPALQPLSAGCGRGTPRRVLVLPQQGGHERARCTYPCRCR